MSKITKYDVNEAAKSLVTLTKEHFKELRKNDDIETMWKKAEVVYFSKMSEGSFTAGELFTHVERVVPKMDKSIFPPDGEWMEARPNDPMNEIQQQDADRATALLKRQFDEVSVRSKLIPGYRSLGIYGTMFIKYFWSRKEKEVYRRINGEREKYFSVTYDNPDFYVPDIWNIYIDPKDENLDGSLIEEVTIDYNDVWKLRKHKDEEGDEVGVYDAEAVEALKEFFIEKNPDADKQQSDFIKGVGDHEYGPHEQKVILNHYWGDVPKWFLTKSKEDKESGELLEDAYIVTGGTPNGEVVLCIKDNPFDHQKKPYFKGNYIKVPGRAYGIGIINPSSIQLSDALDITLLQGIRNRSFNLKTKFIIDRNANVPKDQLIDVDGAIIESDDINGVKPVQVPDMTATIAAHAQLFDGKLQENTGALPFLAGIPAGRSLERTAEGVATMTAGGLERFELVVTHFEQDVLIPLVRGFWALNQQFLPEGRDVIETGNKIVRVLPEQIPFDDFSITFAGIRQIADKNFKVGALNIFHQSPLVQAMATAGQLNLKPSIFEFIKLLGLGHLIPLMDTSQENVLEQSPEGEVQLLIAGRMPRVDLDDQHEAYIEAYQELLKQPNLPDNVRINTEKILQKRMTALKITQIMQQRSTDVGQTDYQQ